MLFPSTRFTPRWRKILKAGAHIINDVTGFAPEMWRAVENTDCGCIVMHPGDPDDLNGAGGDILERVRAFFEKKNDGSGTAWRQ